jgi:serine protease Do
MTGRSRRSWVLVGIAVASAAQSGCSNERPVLAQTRPVASPIELSQPQQRPVSIDTSTAVALSAAFRSAASRALPSVVRINVTSLAPLPEGVPTRQRNSEPRMGQSSGSGFVIDTLGHILTNNHVIAYAQRVAIVMTDGREAEAEIVAADPNTDVGVIRVKADQLGQIVPATFADSDSLRVGDWVLALGNPLDLNFTVTAGILSAKGRNLDILRNADNTQLEAFLQTDAAINPGNSGGPLVDLYGRVVGINTAIQSRTGFFSGAGFAIPINLARKVADDLIQYGVVHRPRLGVTIQDVNAADAEIYRLPAITGVEISSVAPGLPAERAGLQMGDVVVQLEGTPVHTVAELQDRIARLQPGAKVRLSLIRDGRQRDVTVELAQFAPAADRTAPTARAASGVGLLGFSVAPVPASIADPRLEGDHVQLTDIDRFGPAFEAGITVPIFVLLSINGEPMRSVQDVEAFARRLEPGRVVSVVVLNVRDPEGAPTVYNYRVR